MQLPYFTHNKYLLLGYLVCGYLLWVNPREGPWKATREGTREGPSEGPREAPTEGPWEAPREGPL